jgi:hypothetical protein
VLGGWYFIAAESPGWQQGNKNDAPMGVGLEVSHPEPEGPGTLWNRNDFEVYPGDTVKVSALLSKLLPSTTATVQLVMCWDAHGSDPQPSTGEVIAYGPVVQVGGELVEFSATATVPGGYRRARVGLRYTRGSGGGYVPEPLGILEPFESGSAGDTITYSNVVLDRVLGSNGVFDTTHVHGGSCAWTARSTYNTQAAYHPWDGAVITADPASGSFWLYVNAAAVSTMEYIFGMSGASVGLVNNYDGSEVFVFRCDNDGWFIDVEPVGYTGTVVHPVDPLPLDTWLQVEWTYDDYAVTFTIRDGATVHYTLSTGIAEEAFAFAQYQVQKDDTFQNWIDDIDMSYGVTPPPAGGDLMETFEQGTDGETLTLDNVIFGHTGYDAVFTNEQAHGGTLSARTRSSLSVLAVPYRYSPTGVSDDQPASGEFWFRFTGTSTDEAGIFTLWTTPNPGDEYGNVGNRAVEFVHNATGFHVRRYADSGTVEEDVFLPPDTWYRGRWEFVPGGTASFYIDADSSLVYAMVGEPVTGTAFGFTQCFLNDYGGFTNWLDDVGISWGTLDGGGGSTAVDVLMQGPMLGVSP